MTTDPKIRFFKTPGDFRKWLYKNHAVKTELFLGYYKKDSGKKSITWPESVDQALCFGWIDGLRKSIDEVSYWIRFTPRRKTSIWSKVNLKRVEELTKLELMQPSGLKIYEERKEAKSGIYSFEQKIIKLDASHEKMFRLNKKAWNWFKKSPPNYQRAASWWVMSGKQETTRIKRLQVLIEDSEKGQKLKQYQWDKKK